MPPSRARTARSTFQSNFDIYTINPDGSGEVNAQRTLPWSGVPPAWSTRTAPRSPSAPSSTSSQGCDDFDPDGEAPVRCGALLHERGRLRGHAGHHSRPAPSTSSAPPGIQTHQISYDVNSFSGAFGCYRTQHGRPLAGNFAATAANLPDPDRSRLGSGPASILRTTGSIGPAAVSRRTLKVDLSNTRQNPVAARPRTTCLRAPTGRQTVRRSCFSPQRVADQLGWDRLNHKFEVERG